MHKNFIIIFFCVDSTFYLWERVCCNRKKTNFINLTEGVYYHNGILEEANYNNEGFIANVGLIIGEESLLVIDSGPSKKL